MKVLYQSNFPSITSKSECGIRTFLTSTLNYFVNLNSLFINEKLLQYLLKIAEYSLNIYDRLMKRNKNEQFLGCFEVYFT